MPIQFRCACGRGLRAREEFAGKSLNCPACRERVTVPQPEPTDDLDDLDEVDEERAPARAAPRREAKPAPRRLRQDEDEDEDRDDREDEDRVTDRPRRREPERSEEREPERPRRPRLRSPGRERNSRSSSGGGFGSMNAGVAGGLLMIVIAVVWFAVGLYGGYIFFYPPVLLVLGLGAIFKGMSGS